MNFKKLWVLTIILVFFATMGIGAMTRLTGSGLSIVEWKPIAGVLPPLNSEAWEKEFLQYQQYPDFKSRPAMTLSDFKEIYWWEFLHRLVARAILFVILIPYGILLAQKKLEKRHHKRVLGLLLLGGVQGALGWFMVKSGLISVPRVSHLRLMVHFVWASLIVAYLAHWFKEESSKSQSILVVKDILYLKLLSWVCLAQLALGALVAGSRAGYIFNSFPKFGNAWLPESFFIYPGIIENIFYNQINLQFFHRLGGWFFFFAAIYGVLRKFYFISSLIFVQFILGILTLVLIVPPPIATLHQLVGVLMFFSLRFLAFNTEKELL